jgi:hypothetical protein
MRVLFTIPHYFHHGEGNSGKATSHDSRGGNPLPRLQALTECLAALHRLQRPAFVLDHVQRGAYAMASATPTAVDVVLCTTMGRHLLDRLGAPTSAYAHNATTAEPMLLGFACQELLRDRLGDYDYYCYLEDDLIVHDPWLFYKLAWFNSHAGEDKLLQPNRFEAGLGHLVAKLYIDGPLEERVTAPFQNIHDSPPLAGEALGQQLEFRRTLNPHAGCYFLHARQMEHWAQQPHFADRDTRFIGSLETAATLGIMRTFKVYRPAPANADFLEIQHFGTRYLDILGPACQPGQG